MNYVRPSICHWCAVCFTVISMALPGWGFKTAQAAPSAQQEALILSYAAKFVCTEALEPGQYWYGTAAPIVRQETEVLIHNPNAFPVRLFKKAVHAPLERFGEVKQGVAPGKWYDVGLEGDYAFRIDCNDIAKLLSGDPTKEFFVADGVFNHMEGFVVIGIGPQLTAAGTVARFPQLDVTAEYARSSEVLKKDIHYQPWWRYWWWNLPWQLGYPHRRLIRLQPGTGNLNLDPRQLLLETLTQEAQAGIQDEAQRNATVNALQAGLRLPLEPNGETDAEQPPALVAIVGDPQFVSTLDGPALSVDFVLVSNQSPADANPLTGQALHPISVRYPWFPGHWYDLPVLLPQNIHTDMHHYFNEWHTQRWVAAQADEAVVRQVMAFWYPYWCGWGYWWWSWHGSDCIDIGVGEGESLDVEAITPVRVFYPQWPPVSP
jgi:hypothetical protein